jgi:hypothetical protein
MVAETGERILERVGQGRLVAIVQVGAGSCERGDDEVEERHTDQAGRHQRAEQAAHRHFRDEADQDPVGDDAGQGARAERHGEAQGEARPRFVDGRGSLGSRCAGLVHADPPAPPWWCGKVWHRPVIVSTSRKVRSCPR